MLLSYIFLKLDLIQKRNCHWQLKRNISIILLSLNEFLSFFLIFAGADFAQAGASVAQLLYQGRADVAGRSAHSQHVTLRVEPGSKLD